MPNRILKESICSSDTINQLNWMEEVCWYRLIVNCDDYGRFDARPQILKSRLFPLKDSITLKSIESVVKKLATVGLVTLYEYEGRPYIQLSTWDDHQQIRAKKSKYPAPDINCNQMISSDIKCYRNPIQSESNPTRRDGADAPAEEVVIFLTLNDNSEYPVTCSQVQRWEALYPSVDVHQELRDMQGWLETHPKRRKTRRGILAFVNGWLSREQDKPHPAAKLEEQPPAVVEEMVEPTRDMDKHVVQVDPTKPFNLWDLVP